jgi:hypothetical protein
VWPRPRGAGPAVLTTTRDAPPGAVARAGCRELSLMFIGHSEIGKLVLHRCNADKAPLLARALLHPFSGDPPNLLSRSASRPTRETATGGASSSS